jgi:xanthine dehydrogenase iron-sulfur cluster and FAD-binding subunit A
VPELKELTATGAEWRIGAAVTLTEIEERMAAEFPALRRMLRLFGSRQIRNRATMGGNIVAASPIGDSAPVLLASGAKVVIATLPKEDAVEPASITERTLPLDEFFVAYRKTALLPGEVLKTIIVPRFAGGTGFTRYCEFYKVSKRREMDISNVAACFRVDLDEDRTVRGARLAYGGVAATPARALKTEQALAGRPWSEETVNAVLPILRSEFTPISDVRGTADYRRGLTTGLLEKFYHATTATASESSPFEAGDALLPKAVVPPRIRPPPHESAHKHSSGEAIYTDDQTAGRRMLKSGRYARRTRARRF